MTLEEAIRVLMGHTNKDEVVAALQKDAGGIYHAVFQKGYDVAYGKRADEARALEDKLTAAQEAAKATEAKLGDVLKKTPDAAKLKAEYEAEMAKMRDEMASKLTSVQGTLTTERLSARRSAILADLIAKGVDPDYAAVLLEKPDTAKRFMFDDNGGFQIMQAGKSIPYAGSDEEVRKAFVEELATGVNPKFLSSGADAGAGTRTGASGASAGSMYDDIRRDVESRNKAAQENKLAAERMLGGTGLR